MPEPDVDIVDVDIVDTDLADPDMTLPADTSHLDGTEYREAETVEEFVQHGAWVPLGIISSPSVTGHALLGLLSPAGQRALEPWRMLRTAAGFLRWTVPEDDNGEGSDMPGHLKDRLVLAGQLEALAERLLADRSEAFARQAAQAGRGPAGRALDRVAGVGWSVVQRVGWGLYARAARALGTIEDR